jgi:hypothetical protein
VLATVRNWRRRGKETIHNFLYMVGKAEQQEEAESLGNVEF